MRASAKGTHPLTQVVLTKCRRDACAPVVRIAHAGKVTQLGDALAETPSAPGSDKWNFVYDINVGLTGQEIMFCPKCGAQNADGTKFCRGCGSDVSNLPTALDAKQRTDLNLAEKQIELYGSGMRGLIIGIGFLITSSIAFAISIRFAVLGVFMLAFASFFLGTGISRLLQARALKKLLTPISPELSASSPEALPDYVNSPASIYETDDLARIPASVTEHTTTHLERSDKQEQ